MRRRAHKTLLRLLAALALPALGSALSCSDPVDDGLGRACKVIIGCGVEITHGDCIDQLGEEPLECTACIEDSGCDYSSCQRDPVGCRIPVGLLPP
jgi:hypothetical protein